MMKTLWTILIFSQLAMSAWAQEQKSVDQQADEFYFRYEYARAANLYERLAKRKKVKIPVIERLAESYRMINNYAAAEKWYAELLQKQDTLPKIYLYYGDVLKSQGKYAEAKAAYAKAEQKSGPSNSLANRIEGCNAAALWMQEPAIGAIKNVTRLNTSQSDWGATWYSKGVVFMSDSLRKNLLLPGSRTDKNLYGRNKHHFFKLYLADTIRYGNVYLFDLSNVFNQYKYHVGPVSFDSDFQTAWFTITDADRRVEVEKVRYPRGLVIHGSRRLELMVSHRDSSGRWQPAEKFAYNKPEAYSVGHAALSRNGRILYFASDMPGGLGGTDIWFCEQQSDGTWGAPQHTGPAINTPDDEAFPTIAADGMLYYSSKGAIGMGGFDIFSTTGNGNSWSKPQNLRMPFNSPGDDFYLMSHANGTGYFSSNRPGGKGDDDIYSWNSPPSPSTDLVKVFVPGLQIPLNVTVCTKYRASCIYLFNKIRGIGWCFSAADGSFSTKLEPDTEYVLKITTGNVTEIITFKTNGMNSSNVIEKELCSELKK